MIIWKMVFFFSDESYFDLHRNVNKQNLRHYSAKRHEVSLAAGSDFTPLDFVFMWGIFKQAKSHRALEVCNR